MTAPIPRVRWAAAALLLAVPAAACTDDDGGRPESFCRTFAEGDPSATFAGFDPSDPEAALDQLRSARVTLGDLLDDAPGDVQDDLEVEIDYVQALIDALEPVEPGDSTEAALQVQAVTDAHPDVDAAALALAAFAARECGSS